MSLSEIMTEMGTEEILIGINLTVEITAVPSLKRVFIRETIEKVPWLMNLSEIMTELETEEILIGINLTVEG